ncbi:hypothetical protein KP509_24G006000 [Ceratopteris richardii]|uniref:Uncharacterized protein n=1 Tax=Ceratopteris richardii TaxID=49495 RepID=A0A8T2RUV9_CERRI|nr:hypothetical protein KP509_24G006000 [Ceratopteris richardii]
MDSLLRFQSKLVTTKASSLSLMPIAHTHRLLAPSSVSNPRHTITFSSAAFASPAKPKFLFSARNRTSSTCCSCSSGDVAAEGGATNGEILRLLELLTSAFPLWVALACVAALIKPQAFEWIRGGWQIFGLSITMLGMGMTLSFDDFGAAFAMPKELLAGVILQYTVMPSAGAIISYLLHLPPHYAAGLILVACCPGGTASNIVTYLARGNVALSVIMTTVSTFLAVVMTPLLTAKLAGQYVAVDGTALLMSTLQVVLLPVVTGMAMAHYFPRFMRKIAVVAPLVAIIAVAGLCASAIAQNAHAIITSGGQILLAVCSLHAAGFLFGFVLSKLLGFHSSTARTISIEVGMQNSVLGVVLANQHFSNPLTAVPCAISSVCHSIFGSSLAGMWRTISDCES